ncbi:hypothetical protein MAQ5080_02753 [Marinomonas aquimarina]|uniref:Outer membrane protein beta-barrel domain-containing protein n=1 Tax=Marinomonas aquimarina TaxID=295068 RepID=A0A1A8TMC3_9GAMM|nr:hypothetical protein [Marinomonas aquimarina]SBS34023.1 hypothetical protein MAQ5080_02753 [Marinomonas aquimarina]
MKKFVTAALLAGATSAFAAGQFSPLVSYEHVYSTPSTATSNTASMINATMEYTYPRSLSVYGGFTFILRDSFETAAQLGSRFYTPEPLFYVNGIAPVWSYVGLGANVLDNVAFFPEIGFRIGISDNTRLDLFMKVYNSNDTAYDRHATLGAGLTF